MSRVVSLDPEKIHLQHFDSAKDQIQQLLRDLKEAGTTHPIQRAGLQVLDGQNLTYESFSREIPIVDKKKIFGDDHYLVDLMQKFRSEPIIIKPSAGTSNSQVSFKLQSAHQGPNVESLLAFVENLWKIDLKKTIAINAYPATFQFPPCVSMFELGPRPDTLAKFVKNLAASFEAVIIIAQPHFFSYCAQDKAFGDQLPENFFLIMGGTGYAQSFPAYLARMLQVDEKSLRSRTLSLYGAAEVGLGIGLHLPDLAAERELAETTTPSLAFYQNTTEYFVEVVNSRMVVTPLTPSVHLPILRYDTGDHCEWLRGPVNPVFGIGGRARDVSRGVAAEIENLIFSQPELSDSLTGRFNISPDRIRLETRPGRSTKSLRANVTRLCQERKITLPKEVELCEAGNPFDRCYMDLLRKVNFYVE